MWSRVRHRRLQALSLVALAALLTTSLCLGPLYQRSMEQALAGSVLDGATPVQRALTLVSPEESAASLADRLPARVAPYVGAPIAQRSVGVEVDNGRIDIITRLVATDGFCQRVHVVDGRCPTASGEVLVSDADVKVNGWQVGATTKVTEKVDAFFDGPKPPGGPVTIVGVYRAEPDDDSLGAPLTGRAGFSIPDTGVVTDDWLTPADSITGPTAVDRFYRTTTAVSFPLDRDVVDVDALAVIGPAVARLSTESLGNAGFRVDSSLATLAEQVATGREQGRVTVVVLVAQLLVLVAVVLWMVLAAATDDRRAELALARLRGRGRRGAMRYLLAELMPLCLVGVVLGVVAAPPAVALVSRVVFPVDVPLELPRGFVLAALGSAVAVALVVLAAARRAVREPLDSLLRAVRARRAGVAAGVGEVVLVAFSLTAVVALVTGNLEGPLATLAPTLLAVAGGLLLGRALGPATLVLSRALLRRGQAVAAAGIVNSVRRPAARRILVIVVVATALVVFCSDALLTGRQNRENAAEQANGAPYALSVRADSLQVVLDAVEQVDPGHRHVTPVVTASAPGSDEGPTVAVDPVAFGRIALFPRSGRGAFDADAIRAPGVAPVGLTGTRLTGAVDYSEVGFRGISDRADEVQAQLQVLRSDGSTDLVDLGQVPELDSTVPLDLDLDCAEGCVVTGMTVHTPPGLVARGRLAFHDLAVDGTPVALGGAGDWRAVTAGGGTLEPDSDPAGDLVLVVDTTGAQPPVMLHDWVPDPVPALVSGPVTSAERTGFSAPGLDAPTPMTVAGTLPRVPGSPPGSRVVDLAGLVRRPDASISNDVVEVWADSAASATAVSDALRAGGAEVDLETSVREVRAGIDASPAAWSLALSVLVGVAAVLVAALVMIVATATTWRARATDLAALRMAGLPDRSVRRMERLSQLPVVVVGAVAGAVSGVLAAVLALPGVRQFTVVPDVDTTDFSTPWLPVGVAALAALAVLVAIATSTALWTARRAWLSRIRDAV